MSVVKITIRHQVDFDDEYNMVYVDGKKAFKTHEHANILYEHLTKLIDLLVIENTVVELR